MEIDLLASAAAASRGGGGGDSANAKRKLEASAAPSALPCSALSPPGGQYADAATCHPWAAALDSQPKVRRRGSCMAPPGSPSSAMKRCCSESKITRALGRPVSPSAAVLRAAQGKSGSPRQPDRCGSPSAGDDSPLRPASDRPGLGQAPPSPFSATPVKGNGPQPLGWSPGARPLVGMPSPRSLSPAAAAAPPPAFPSPVHGHSAPAHPKRTWPPRRSRNPGNLSLDMSQVDHGVPESLSAMHQRNDQAAVCSQLTDFLFIGGAAAAKDKAALTQAGITHVLNCAASVAPAFYPGDFCYYNLWLRDHSTQDVARHFYAVFDFIERARKRGGRVFVHCLKGISRSPTMAIAYLMWYKGIGMYEALELVRQARPVVDPNAGFIFQLTEWEQLHVKGRLQLHQPVVFRIEVSDRESSSSNSSNSSADMDSIGNGAWPAERPMVVGPLLDVEKQFFRYPSEDAAARSFVVARADYMCVWCGRSASEQQVAAARAASELLQAYEAFPAKCDVLYEGRETPAFWRLLGEDAPPDD